MVGWNGSGYRWHRSRRQPADLPETSAWTLADTAMLLVAAWLRWELAVAFLAVKLWQQATGYRGSTSAFVREKWQALVGAARSLLSGDAISSLHIGLRSSGNHAFDRWRQSELARIDEERERLRVAERDFNAYRDELLHAKDREDFERFMQVRRPPDDTRPGLRRAERD